MREQQNFLYLTIIFVILKLILDANFTDDLEDKKRRILSNIHEQYDQKKEEKMELKKKFESKLFDIAT